MKASKNNQVRAIVLAVSVSGLGFVGASADAQIIVRRAAPIVVVEQPAPVMVVQQPQMAVVAAMPADGYAANPLDVVLVQAAPAPADVVFIGGSTYVWVRDDYGHRVRRFYGAGDLRHEVFARHEMLNNMRRENGGRLPEPGMHRDAMGHWGGGPAAREGQAHGNERADAHAMGHAEVHANAAPGAAPHPGAAPAPAAQQHAAAAAPAPAKKKEK
jgi:hypothetical protein